MTPLQLYRKYFPRTPINFVQEDLMSEVTNLEVWQKTLIEWAGNGWRGESVFKMLQMYRDKLMKYQNDTPEPVVVCKRCNDIGTVMQPKTGGRYNWEMEDVPCPECAGVMV
jgi:hypothetical protein